MNFFFDIPVYRIREESYEAQQEDYVRSEMKDDTPGQYVAIMYANNPDIRERERLMKNYGGPWQFNEIIGYIRLYFYGTQIRGEWWRTNSQKVTRSRTKRFEYRDPKVTYEEEIPRGSTSRQIYDLIQKYLARAQAEKHVKRFYLDTSVFELIGRHVDWNALYGEAHTPARPSCLESP